MKALRILITVFAGTCFAAAAAADEESSAASETFEGEEELLPPDAEEDFEEWRQNRRQERESRSLFEGFGEGTDGGSDASEWDSAVPDVTGPIGEFGGDFDAGTSSDYMGFDHLAPPVGGSAGAMAEEISSRDETGDPGDAGRAGRSPASSVIGDFESYLGTDSGTEGGSRYSTDLIADGPLGDFDPFDFSDRPRSASDSGMTEIDESRFDRQARGLTVETSDPETDEPETFEPGEEEEQNPAYYTFPHYLSP